jgi:hypothetical protein
MEKFDPVHSKCFTCKFGLAMLQENTAIMEANFPIPGIEPEAEPDMSIVWEDAEGPKKIIETRVCSLCYWAPPGFVMNTPIINIATIKECSRYEKRD